MSYPCFLGEQIDPILTAPLCQKSRTEHRQHPETSGLKLWSGMQPRFQTGVEGESDEFRDPAGGQFMQPMLHKRGWEETGTKPSEEVLPCRSFLPFEDEGQVQMEAGNVRSSSGAALMHLRRCI